MIKYQHYLMIASLLFASLTFAHENEEVKGLLKSVFEDNAEHVSAISHEDFKAFSDEQNPRATIITCSDSRVQSDAFHKSPVNDLFFIRNIGNQIRTTEGSIEYGVNHLHTPLLIIMGHSHCGAITAALGNYSKESKALRVELDHLHLSPKISTNEGVIENVHHQVAYALTKFKEKIAKDELVVVGAVYDFRDDFKDGHGRLILINFNGEKDPAKIKQNAYIKELKDVFVGVK